MTFPAEMSSTNIKGVVSKTFSPTEEIWQVIAPPEIELRSIALLLGMLILDQQENIIQTNLMPSRACAATLLGGGEIRQGRGKIFAPWVLFEIQRLAEVLLLQHLSYISDIKDALGGGMNTFGSLPADFIIRDQAHQCRLGPPPPSIEVDVSHSERVRGNLRWDQIILEDYLRNRYMTDLRDEQLDRRIGDIAANIHEINTDGLISLDKENPLNFYWLARFQEARAEKSLRLGTDISGWPPGYINRDLLPGSLNNGQLTRREILKPPASLTRPFLVKYSDRKFIENALQYGRIKISPASSYKDSSLNTAIKDEELVREINFDPGQFDIYHSDQESFPSSSTRKLIHKKINTDYYVYCTASKLSTRLLYDFEKEAALVIHNPNIFLQRLDNAMKLKFRNWRPVVEYVQYYDPLQVTPREIDVLLWKHFRYAYQKEVRVAWWPPQPIPKLGPVLVELGPLSDIAEILLPTPIENSTTEVS